MTRGMLRDRAVAAIILSGMSGTMFLGTLDISCETDRSKGAISKEESSDLTPHLPPDFGDVFVCNVNFKI